MENKLADSTIDLIDSFDIASILCDSSHNVINLSEESFLGHVEAITSLCRIDQTYVHTEHVEQLFDFIFINLEMTNSSDILLQLLRLLVLSLFTIVNKSLTHLYGIVNLERIFATLENCCKKLLFKQTHAIEVAAILPMLILSSELSLSKRQQELLENITSKLFEFGLDLYPYICNVVIERLSFCSSYNKCICWILNDSANSLGQTQDESILFYTLETIIKSLTQYNAKINFNKQQYQQMNLNLLKNLDKILNFLNNSSLKNYAKTLAKILYDFAQEKGEVILESIDIMEELTKFSEIPLNDWWISPSPFFFITCHLLLTYSSLIWKSSQVLEGIYKMVFSKKRLSLQLGGLRSACCLYPQLNDFSNISNHFLGEQLIEMMYIYKEHSKKLLMFKQDQLVWLIGRANKSLFREIVIFWLEESKNVNILGDIIQKRRKEWVLLNILLEENDDTIAKKIVNLICTMNSETLRKTTPLFLPKAWESSNFNRLIMCPLGVPDHQSICLQLLSFLSKAIPQIKTDEILRKICSYVIMLIFELRKDEKSWTYFCRIDTLQHLVNTLLETQENETSLQILLLLKKIQLVQKRNHLQSDLSVSIDWSRCLNGPKLKILKTLDTIRLGLLDSRLIIREDEESVLNILVKLMDLDNNFNLLPEVYDTMKILLNKYEWMIHTRIMGAFVLMKCSTTNPDDEEAPILAAFIMHLLKLLHKSKEDLYSVEYLGGNVTNFMVLAVKPKELIPKILRRMQIIRKKSCL